jgi:hypothetical protein
MFIILNISVGINLLRNIIILNKILIKWENYKILISIKFLVEIKSQIENLLNYIKNE